MGDDPLRDWLQDGTAKGATHMLVVCDTFNYENFPVYVLPSQNVFLVADRHRTEPEKMRKLMEVYSYALPLEPQLAQRRAAHYEVSADIGSSPRLVGEEEAAVIETLKASTGTLDRLLSNPHPHSKAWREAVTLTLRPLLKAVATHEFGVTFEESPRHG